MPKIICNNPQIEQSIDATRILRALARQGFATVDADGVFTVDWQKVNETRSLHSIGKKYEKLVRDWSKSIDTHTDTATTITALRAMLKRLEWDAYDDDVCRCYCSICNGKEPTHAPGCELDALLKESEAHNVTP